jgi:hypothetical protein
MSRNTRGGRRHIDRPRRTRDQRRIALTKEVLACLGRISGAAEGHGAGANQPAATAWRRASVPSTNFGVRLAATEPGSFPTAQPIRYSGPGHDEHTTTISGRAANDAGQHARQRRAVARSVLLGVPSRGGAERRLPTTWRSRRWGRAWCAWRRPRSRACRRIAWLRSRHYATQGEQTEGKPQPNGKERLGSGNRALSSGKCDGGAARRIYLAYPVVTHTPNM